jgi:cobalamin biosynthesis protein CobT
LNSENQTNSNNTNKEQQSEGSEGNESEGSEGNESEGSEGNESEGSGSESDNSEYTLTEKQITQLEKIFETQQNFINDDAKKTKLTKDASLQVEALSSLDITEVMTAKHLNNESSTFKGVKTLVINNVTENFMKSDIARGFGLAMYPWSVRGESLEHAISLGKVLAKRLQVRNEERSLASKRLKSGKIDNRMLHEIGFDNYDIFKKINVSQYKPSYIHISIDQSGSMSGDRFEESVKFATMFAVASKSIKNLHVVVTARSTFHSGGNNKLKDTPYIVYLFDSKKHNINDIRRVFGYIRTSNLTPEGLTFEAIQNEVMKSSVNTDAYFINLCDGEPCAEYNGFKYSGDEAKEHSRRQVDKMKQRGVNIMNYFFGDQYEYSKFLKTYPKNSYMLKNAEEVNSIVKIMNRELLSGASKQND